jgi:hypothetical protein
MTLDKMAEKILQANGEGLQLCPAIVGGTMVPAGRIILAIGGIR